MPPSSSPTLADRRAIQQEQLVDIKNQIEELDHKISGHIDAENNDIEYVKVEFKNITKKVEDLTHRLEEVKIKVSNIENSLPVRMDKYEKNQEAADEKLNKLEIHTEQILAHYAHLSENVKELLKYKEQNREEHGIMVKALEQNTLSINEDLGPKVNKMFDIITVWEGFSRGVGWIADNAKKISAIILLVGSLLGGMSWTAHYLQSNFIIQEVKDASR